MKTYENNDYQLSITSYSFGLFFLLKEKNCHLACINNKITANNFTHISFTIFFPASILSVAK
jgi:hypothetical protein